MAAGDKPVVPPPVMWAQRNDRIFVTFNLEDCKDHEARVTENLIKFKGTGGSDKSPHSVEMELYDKVDPESLAKKVTPRSIELMIKRKESGPYWPRLLKSTQRMHWLKTDFEKWRDEFEDQPGDTCTEWFDVEGALADVDEKYQREKYLKEKQKKREELAQTGEEDAMEYDQEDSSEDSDDGEMPDLE